MRRLPMRRRCPNQRRARCRRRDDAAGCVVRSRMIRLLMCCYQNTRMRRRWQRMSNTSNSTAAKGYDCAVCDKSTKIGTLVVLYR